MWTERRTVMERNPLPFNGFVGQEKLAITALMHVQIKNP
jgi:hypothetical protein